MRTLYLHIGHGKTGTSFIQSSLVRSIDNLAAHGILYPIRTSDRNLGLEGKISTGNAWGALDSLQKFDSWLGVMELNFEDSVLLSSESLFEGLYLLVRGKDGAERLNALETLLQARGFDRCKILLYVRDPEDLYSSGWQQLIKRGGETRSIEALEHEFGFRYVKATARIIEILMQSRFYELKIVNYSFTHNVLEPLAEWLEMSAAQFNPPPKEVVNRSLSTSELEFIRCMNLALKQRGLGNMLASSLSDMLCNELSHIKAQHTSLPLDLADRLWRDAEDSLKILNAHLSKNTQVVRLERELIGLQPSDAPIAPYSFSLEQIETIAEFFCEQFRVGQDTLKVRQKKIETLKLENKRLSEALEAERKQYQTKLLTDDELLNDSSKEQALGIPDTNVSSNAYSFLTVLLKKITHRRSR